MLTRMFAHGFYSVSPSALEAAYHFLANRSFFQDGGRVAVG